METLSQNKTKEKTQLQKEQALIQSAFQLKTEILKKHLPKRGEDGETTDQKAIDLHGALRRMDARRKTDILLITSEPPKASA